ncbi:hypothetical protein T03_13793 [Trichinella britovi]|uniref:Uncharacterized protein n=1 Tax=Trichinella britovi TaxID=45882 RepID=A0A0V1C8M4_TRIBR|nr:hypothetical protein T03_13793 [Trichinella britovi]
MGSVDRIRSISVLGCKSLKLVVRSQPTTIDALPNRLSRTDALPLPGPTPIQPGVRLTHGKALQELVLSYPAGTTKKLYRQIHQPTFGCQTINSALAFGVVIRCARPILLDLSITCLVPVVYNKLSISQMVRINRAPDGATNGERAGSTDRNALGRRRY